MVAGRSQPELEGGAAGCKAGRFRREDVTTTEISDVVVFLQLM